MDPPTMIYSAVTSIIDKYRWSELPTSTGNASGIPERLCGLIAAQNAEEAKLWYFQLENYIVVQGGVYESALPSLDVLLAALRRCPISDVAIAYIYDLIYQIINGTPDIDAVKRGNFLEVEYCKILIRTNMQLLKEKCVEDADETFELIVKAVA